MADPSGREFRVPERDFRAVEAQFGEPQGQQPAAFQADGEVLGADAGEQAGIVDQESRDVAHLNGEAGGEVPRQGAHPLRVIGEPFPVDEFIDEVELTVLFAGFKNPGHAGMDNGTAQGDPLPEGLFSARSERGAVIRGPDFDNPLRLPVEAQKGFQTVTLVKRFAVPMLVQSQIKSAVFGQFHKRIGVGFAGERTVNNRNKSSKITINSKRINHNYQKKLSFEINILSLRAA